MFDKLWEGRQKAFKSRLSSSPPCLWREAPVVIAQGLSRCQRQVMFEVSLFTKHTHPDLFCEHRRNLDGYSAPPSLDMPDEREHGWSLFHLSGEGADRLHVHAVMDYRCTQLLQRRG